MRLTTPTVLTFLLLAGVAEAREPNNLAGSESPYLLQHLYNPVDWYPWGEEALEKARRENKPIFVSVGYSSCHWCHVMEAESFEDEGIAALLNAHFVSIKIDRESRPDLDEQFMAVTQILSGGGGWPNTVFLTPSGDPYFGGGYFPPDDFMNVVQQVGTAWRNDPGFVQGEAEKVKAVVSRYLAQTAEARAVTTEVSRAAAAEIVDETDFFNGGYGVAPKFPREAMFLFLLDEFERSGNATLLQAVTDMLDSMIKGGIHDHVGGGFHRYAVDPEWHVPHFEKMLYTQALTGRLLVRVWSITGEERYRRAAERTFDYVLRDLRDPAGGFYSAEDADSRNAAGERVEGLFYMWRPEDLEPLGAEAGFLREVFQISAEGDLDGMNILNLAALPEEQATRMDQALAQMLDLREARTRPFLDTKIVVSWNAVMIETLAEAGYRLQRSDYSAAAEDAARFILDRMHVEGGLRRIWFEGEAVIPAQLPDYAAMGNALVALHDYASDAAEADRWLSAAVVFADELRARFGEAGQGFRMTETREGLGDVIPVDDAKLPAGNALALTLFARLADRTQAPGIELDAYRLAAALSGLAVSTPAPRAFSLKAIRELQEGSTGPVRYAAKGALRIELLNEDERFSLQIDIAEGWHINAHQPLDDFFIATELVVPDTEAISVVYPEPAIKSLSFNDAPLALYEGRLRITADVAPSGSPQRAVLTLQACSDEICLQPEDLSFVLW